MVRHLRSDLDRAKDESQDLREELQQITSLYIQAKAEAKDLALRNEKMHKLLQG